MGTASRRELPGSDRQVPLHERVGDADRGAQAEVTVYLRRTSPLGWVDSEAANPLPLRLMLPHPDFEAGFGASADDIRLLRSFAGEYGLEITDVNRVRRTVTLRGALGNLADAFGAQGLALYEHPDGGAYRGRSGPLTVPDELGGRSRASSGWTSGHKRARISATHSTISAARPQRRRGTPPGKSRRPTTSPPGTAPA